MIVKYFLRLSIILFVPIITKGQTIELYVGTYTQNNKSQGIYIYSFNQETGVAQPIDTLITPNPSFLTLSQNKNHLFTVNELGRGKGSVSAFKRTPKTGFTFINSMSSGGDAPCHITTAPSGHFLVVSNYSGGSLSVFRTTKEGELEERIQHFEYEGRGPDSVRQKAPHIHSASFSPDGQLLLVQDLGTDQIYSYSFDSENQEVPLTRIGSIKTSGGGGPRHVVFSNDGKRLYLVEEMGSKVSVFEVDNGVLSFMETHSLLEEGFKNKTAAADIHISPDGRFLYASNRGEANDITIFKVKKNGRLKRIQRQSVLGEGPRSFIITPNGRYLLVANQYTNEIKVFNRNQRTGILKDTGEDIVLESPVCLKF